MHRVRQVLASSFLVLAAAPDIVRADEGVRLTAERSTQSLHVLSLVQARVFLVVGPVAAPPIRIGVDLDVVPLHVVDLGERSAGEALHLFVPRGLYELHAEAISVDAALELRDSNVVALADVYADLVEATFHAELRQYAVHGSLRAPTSGYELTLDAVDLHGDSADVYLRLLEPGEGEVTIPILTEHHRLAHLGPDVGRVVRVHLLRRPRGAIGIEVYRLMATLPVD